MIALIVHFFTILPLILAHKFKSKVLLHLLMPVVLLNYGVFIQLIIADFETASWISKVPEENQFQFQSSMITVFALNFLFLFTDFRFTLFINIPLTYFIT
jgi:hypothetical protein